MNSFFEGNEEDLKDFFESIEDYESDPNYNKDLDVNYELKISKKESEIGAEKEIKIKRDIWVCKKGCNTCNRETDKIYNLIENKCGIIEKRDEKVIIKIPIGVRDGDKIVFIGDGRRENNKYGNLVVILKIKEKVERRTRKNKTKSFRIL